MSEDLNKISIESLKPDSVQVGFKAVANITTAHLCAKDAAIMASEPRGLPGYIGGDEFGYWMDTCPFTKDMETTPSWEKVESSGVSETFIALMRAFVERDIYYVCFDYDGYELKEFPVFDW